MADTIFEQMSILHGLKLEEEGFTQALRMSISLSWTRDPFDRIITAHASLFDAPLLTKDSRIQHYYQRAVW